MTGQIVSDLTLILLSDFIRYNPRSRNNALFRYKELSAINPLPANVENMVSSE